MISEPRILSASNSGRGILLGNSSPGNGLHTGPSVSNQVDEIWLWAMNSHTSSLLVTIEWGGTSSPQDLIRMTIPVQDGPYPMVPGFKLLGNSTPLTVAAFAGTASVVAMFGYVNRITYG